MRRHPFIALGVAIGLLVTAGCRREPPGAVSLIPVTFDQWQEKLAGYRGSIVVVDMWATWCAPCLERFPHMVKLHQRYRRQGVAFVSMCLDDREDPDALALARQFLRRQQAVFDNYLMDEVVPDAFEKLDLATIPAVFIYDGKGQLRHRLTADDPNRQFKSQDVDKALEDLLLEQQANGQAKK